MEKLLWVFCILGVSALVNGATPSDAPSPSVDCSTVLLSMADCLTFVMNGSTVSKPEGSCCSGFKTVLKENVQCLCESFNNNHNMGVDLNMTKATTLPSACGVSTNSLSSCAKVSDAPSAAPVSSPSAAPKFLPSPTSSNPSSTGGNAEVAAPSPSQSSSAAVFTPTRVLAIGLAVATCSYFL